MHAGIPTSSGLCWLCLEDLRKKRTNLGRDYRDPQIWQIRNLRYFCRCDGIEQVERPGELLVGTIATRDDCVGVQRRCPAEVLERGFLFHRTSISTSQNDSSEGMIRHMIIDMYGGGDEYLFGCARKGGQFLEILPKEPELRKVHDLLLQPPLGGRENGEDCM